MQNTKFAAIINATKAAKGLINDAHRTGAKTQISHLGVFGDHLVALHEGKLFCLNPVFLDTDGSPTLSTCSVGGNLYQPELPMEERVKTYSDYYERVITEAIRVDGQEESVEMNKVEETKAERIARKRKVLHNKIIAATKAAKGKIRDLHNGGNSDTQISHLGVFGNELVALQEGKLFCLNPVILQEDGSPALSNWSVGGNLYNPELPMEERVKTYADYDENEISEVIRVDGQEEVQPKQADNLCARLLENSKIEEDVKKAQQVLDNLLAQKFGEDEVKIVTEALVSAYDRINEARLMEEKELRIQVRKGLIRDQIVEMAKLDQGRVRDLHTSDRYTRITHVGNYKGFPVALIEGVRHSVNQLVQRDGEVALTTIAMCILDENANLPMEERVALFEDNAGNKITDVVRVDGK